MTNHKIVNREEWTDAHNELLVREKEHTRLGDDLARQRRELPWVPVDKEYRFENDEGGDLVQATRSDGSSVASFRWVSLPAGCEVLADGVPSKCSPISPDMSSSVLRGR